MYDIIQINSEVFQKLESAFCSAYSFYLFSFLFTLLFAILLCFFFCFQYTLFCFNPWSQETFIFSVQFGFLLSWSRVHFPWIIPVISSVFYFRYFLFFIVNIWTPPVTQRLTILSRKNNSLAHHRVPHICNWTE